MTTDGDRGQWSLAKARQLKERALRTADRTRRKQFLLIATEYQKLAHVEAPVHRAIGLHKFAGNAPEVSPPGQIVLLRPGVLSTPPTRIEAQIDDAEQSQQSGRLTDLVVFAVVTLVAFALVLMPGDQTEGGLHTLFSAFFN